MGHLLGTPQLISELHPDLQHVIELIVTPQKFGI